MSNYTTHIDQARHNELFANRLSRRLVTKDWYVTVTFYSAVHFVEAALFNNTSYKHSEHHPSRGSFHEKRLNSVYDLYPTAYNSYKQLKDLCTAVRYLTSGTGHINMNAKAYLGSIFPNDSDLKKHIKTLLSDIKKELGL